MRTADYLLRLYPNRTGKEILAIQEKDKLQDEKEEARIHKDKLAIIKDLNENGGYFYGRFGSDQRYFYRFYDLFLERGEIRMTADSITFFYNDPEENHRSNSGVKPFGELKFNFRTREYAEFSTFGVNFRERVTVKEWDEVLNYAKSMTKFWEKIKPV